MKLSVIISTTFLITASLLFSAGENQSFAQTVKRDTLPHVLAENHGDLMEARLRSEALQRFSLLVLPTTKEDWAAQGVSLKKEIIKKAGIVVDHDLPLHYQEMRSKKMDGYVIKSIIFQTRPGVYATANLYVPEGEGPFPAVVTMHGHWPEGRLYESFQAIGQSLALNGYVCLTIDAYGAGERTTVQGTDEYHGSNLGASLMNIGETLLGIQVSDNMRAVDLLSSLPYVNAGKIGATGASGGGNQTMWLAALDDRIKAAMPVVSIGTFESYIMRSNCVCELLPDGMTFMEESAVIALMAPNAIKMCNIIHDNPTFLSTEMLRTFNNAKPVFKMLGVENKISYEILDKTHGYWPENREILLGWFDLHLKGKGNGDSVKEIPFETLPNEQLKAYAKGQRDAKVETIAEYCKRKGSELRTAFLNTKSFDAAVKKKQIADILRIHEKSELKEVHHYLRVDGWDRLALEVENGKLIPLLMKSPRNQSADYVIVCNTQGKDQVSASLLDEIAQKGLGIVLVDLSGIGEAASIADTTQTKMKFHTIARSELWLGRTLMGEWVKELGLVAQFLKTAYKAQKVSIDGTKEAGLAGLFLATLENNVDHITLRDAPVSYLFDNRESVDYFSLGIHLPGFLNWGDVSLAAGLSGKNIAFINPVSMSGTKISGAKLEAFRDEFNKIRSICHQPGKTILTNQ